MADIQREKDERIEKNPSSADKGNLRKDDDSKVEEKNRGTANSGRQDSNIGRGSSGSVGGSQSGNLGDGKTGQGAGRDQGADKGINKPGMNR
jgi:hypothetical protein